MGIFRANLLKRRYHLILLTFLVLFIGIINYLWIKNNSTYYYVDDYYHLTFSNEIYNTIFSDTGKPNFLSYSAFYQRPLIPAITAIFIYPLFGIGANVAIMINVIFLAILVFSTYAIGRKIYNKKTGMTAAFLVSMYPIIFSISRYYTYFIGLTALITLSIYLLLLSNRFKNLRYSLFFGLSCGIGMLINIFFVLFIVGPVLYVIFSSMKSCGRDERRKIFSNIAAALLICFLIAGIWHIYSVIKYDYFEYISPLLKTEVSVIFKYSRISILFRFILMYYLEKLINYQIFIPFFILFCIGLFFYIKSKKKNGILLLWILVPYFIISFKVFKRPEYIIPILPALAILSSFWIFEMKNKKLQRSIVILILIFGFTQFFIVSYSKILSNSNIFGFKIEDYTNPPSKVDWNENEILTYIMNNSKKYPAEVAFLMPVTSKQQRGANTSVYEHVLEIGFLNLTYSSTSFNPVILAYYSSLHQLPVDIYYLYFYEQIHNNSIPYFDFLIVNSDLINTKNVNETITAFKLNNFHLDKNFSLPYNNEITIFKKYQKTNY